MTLIVLRDYTMIQLFRYQLNNYKVDFVTLQMFYILIFLNQIKKKQLGTQRLQIVELCSYHRAKMLSLWDQNPILLFSFMG